MHRPFIKGLTLSQFLYEQAIAPIMAAHWTTVRYSAARLGPGSDVLGFDTPQSMDHDWGPKLTLYLSEEDYRTHHNEIWQTLAQELPDEICGFPTSFGDHNDGTTHMAPSVDGAARHQVAIRTIRSFFVEYLGYEADREPQPIEWLTFAQQRLRTIASGRVFYDGLHRLETVRTWLSYYPHDIWLYLLAVQWRRIAQEEAFMARCGDVGDELGSRLIAARMVVELIRLCFLMERQYTPYSKWLGTAFAQLDCAQTLAPIFDRILHADHWQDREIHLSAAYGLVAKMHNALHITDPLPTEVSPFHSRPYLVIQADAFQKAIRAAIADEAVRSLPAHLGSVDQFVDSTDVLESIARCRQIRCMYRLTDRKDST